MAITAEKKIIGVFTLAMINTAAIVNITNLPAMVVLGYSLISYLILAAVFFFLPTAFVSAELATGFPQRGGYYSWVRIAFGPVIGFMGIWLQWLANVIWYPTLLSPIVYSSLKVFAPSLINDKWTLFIAMTVIFWALTALNLRGMRESSLVSAIGVILGSILPATLVIFFAAIWIGKGFPIDLHFEFKQLIPPLDNFNNMSILISVLITLTGMEMSAVHVNSVVNPRKTYPRAALIASLIILSFFMFTSLAMAVIVPPGKIDLVNGAIQTFQEFGNAMHMPWLLPVLTILTIIGILTVASTWIAGPSKGLQVAALDGDLPSFFQKENPHDMPGRIMVMQAIIYTIMSLAFVFIPSVNSSYWILVALTSLLYMSMYFLLFCTGLRLRYKYPQVLREYTIPGKWNSGMWIICICGMMGTAAAFVISFYPPAQFSLQEGDFYVRMLAIAYVVSFILPVVLFSIYYYFKRKRAFRDLFFTDTVELPLAEAQRLPLVLEEELPITTPPTHKKNKPTN